MTTLAVMNPPRGTKTNPRASKAQLAWRRQFVARFGGGGGKKSKPKSQRPRSNPPLSVRGGGKGKGGGKRRARGMVRDLMTGAMGGLAVGVGGAVGFAATSKLPDYIPPNWLKDASGAVPLWKRFAAKIAVGLAVYVPTRIAGQLVGGRAGALISKASEAMLAGSTSNILFDAAVRAVPQVAPRTLTGDDDMGEFIYAQLTPGARAALPAGAGVGAFINAQQVGEYDVY